MILKPASREHVALAIRARLDLNEIRKNAAEAYNGFSCPREISFHQGRKPTSGAFHLNFISGYSAEHPEDFICPVSYDPIIDPVVAEDGYTYERSTITKWFELGHDLKELNQQINSFREEKGQSYLEGLKQGILLGNTLVPHVALKSAIDTWVEQHALPLHLACINGDMNRVQTELTKNPLLINSMDVSHKTALEYAAQHDHPEILSYLLSCPNLGGVHQYQNHATFSTTALYWAAGKGHVRIVSILLDDHRVDPNHVLADGHSITALMHAADNDHTNVVEVMLNHHRVDANVVCSYNNATAFYFACGGDAHKKLGFVSTVQVFLDHQQQTIAFNASATANNAFFETGLHYAVANGHSDIVRLLVQDPRIDVNQLSTSENGATPLHTAATGWWVQEAFDRGSMEERLAMLSVLLECPRIDASVTDGKNRTSLACCLNKDTTAGTEIRVALAMKFLEHGTGISKNEVPKWFHINHSAKVRLALFQKVRSVRNEWRQPLLIFHLCRSRNNAESSLAVFRTRWPLLVADLLLQFLTPFEHVVTHYEKTLNDVNQKGLTSLYELCHIQRYGSKNFVLHQTSLIDLRYFLNIGDIDVNTLGPPGGPPGNLFGYGYAQSLCYAAPENTRLSPMKYAENEGHDEEFLSILRNAGGQPLAKEIDSEITFSIKDQTGRETFFKWKQSTRMRKVYFHMRHVTGVYEKPLRFSIGGREVDYARNTPFLLGLKNQDQIDCQIAHDRVYLVNGHPL
jgi:ankyrin repeat protein